MDNTTDKPSILPKPRLTLRLAFAGSRRLDDEKSRKLHDKLVKLFTIIGHQLTAIAPKKPVSLKRKYTVAPYFDKSPPLLRLVTGLCEGADTIAAKALGEVRIPPEEENDRAESPCLDTKLAAVLPFDFETYRESRDKGFLPDFDRQAKKCEYILTLDGLYDKSGCSSVEADKRRAAGYRAQSTFLLRHGDILVAAANPEDKRKAGGTLDTVQMALEFGLPVIFIDTRNTYIHVMQPSSSLHRVIFDPYDDNGDKWEEEVRNAIDRLVANPDIESMGHTLDAGEKEAIAELDKLLNLFFYDADTPAKPKWGPKANFRELSWKSFLRRLRKTTTLPRSAENNHAFRARSCHLAKTSLRFDQLLRRLVSRGLSSQLCGCGDRRCAGCRQPNPSRNVA